VQSLPSTRQYRVWLDKVSHDRDWVVGAAVLTIFVEGSVNDRKELARPPGSKSAKQIQQKLRNHPLVLYHGVSLQAMDLIRAHQMVEAGHRHDAYAMVVHYAATRSQQEKVLTAMRNTLDLWLRYRDGVARACRLKRELG